MKLKDLNEVSFGVVNFSDLQTFNNMSPEFWIGMKTYINQYKKLGKDKAIETVAKRVKKIGEENYNSLKSVSDKNKFSVPDFAVASSVTKLKASKGGQDKIVTLMDLVSSKAAIRKSKLQANLEKLQKQIEQLED